ncbi:MAG TPA: hypothetical protein DCX19_00690 [Alphaproteobacteria bacterium]|nr:hypothetical protein [Alphaproteobacteria bacterium]
MIIRKLLTNFFFTTAAIFILSGCATISKGTTQTLKIMTTANRQPTDESNGNIFKRCCFCFIAASRIRKKIFKRFDNNS